MSNAEAPVFLYADLINEYRSPQDNVFHKQSIYWLSYNIGEVVEIIFSYHCENHLFVEIPEPEKFVCECTLLRETKWLPNYMHSHVQSSPNIVL